jgi:glycerate dehydrogenase
MAYWRRSVKMITFNDDGEAFMVAHAATKGVFLDSDTVGDDIDLSSLSATLPEWEFRSASLDGTAVQDIGDAAVIVTNKVRIDDEAMSRAPALRLICVAATGTDRIDLESARRRGITVCNVRAYATASVVQHVFMLMFALATSLAEYRDAVRSGRWQRSRHFAMLDYPIGELGGRRLGIVGYGELGRAVAATARCFGMEVEIAARPGTAPSSDRVALEELLPRVDVLSLHCPLTEETRGLIGARELSLMKPSALLINTARGGIVDEAALAQALRRGALAGAGIDVLGEEPPRNGNPLLSPDVPRLIVTPHIAWASRESRQRLIGELRLNVEAFLSGNPRNRV